MSKQDTRCPMCSHKMQPIHVDGYTNMMLTGICNCGYSGEPIARMRERNNVERILDFVIVGTCVLTILGMIVYYYIAR